MRITDRLILHHLSTLHFNPLLIELVHHSGLYSDVYHFWCAKVDESEACRAERC